MADLQRKIAPGAPPREHVANFTRQRFRWIDAVAGEPRLPAAAKAIAVKFFVRHFNAEHGGCAWLSATKLAEEIGASERTARAALQQLAELGFLEVTPRARATSIYRMTLPASTTAEITPQAGNADIATRGNAMKKQSVREKLPGSALPPDCPEADFRPLPGDAAEVYPEVQRAFTRKPASDDSNIGIQIKVSLSPFEKHILERADDDDEHVLDEQAEPSPLMAAALRRFDEQPLDDELSLDEQPQTVEIAAAAPKGSPGENVQAAPSPASMSSDERVAARKRLLEELAALDAIEPDPSSAKADRRRGAIPSASEDDRSATVAAEQGENAPASPAEALKSETEEMQAFHEIGKSPEPAAPAAAPAAGGDLFGDPAKPKKLTAAQIAEAFARFWAVFPKKAGKRDAQLAFESAAKRGVDLEHVITAAERYGAAVKAAEWESRFVKWPQGWIRGQRYDDDPSTLPQPRSGHAPGRHERGSTSMENFHRGQETIRRQAEAAERSRRIDELVAQGESFRNAKSPF